MKHSFLIAIALVALSAMPAHAQIAITAPKVAPIVQTAPLALVPSAAVDASTLIKTHEKVSADFRETHMRLSALSTRTSLALGHLTQKDITTSKALASLDAATISLANAQVSIDSFTTIATQKVTPTTGILLKQSAEKAELELDTARDALIKSLITLKASLTSSPTIAL